MFDIGFWELALIGIVALLVVGPEKMPAMIKTAGQWAGQIQRLASDLRREIENEATSQEYKALNADFLAEDQRVKEMVRKASAVNPLADSTTSSTGPAADTPAATPAEDTPAQNDNAAQGDADVAAETRSQA